MQLKRVINRLRRMVADLDAKNEIPAEEPVFSLPTISLVEFTGTARPAEITVLSTQIERPRDMVLPLTDLLSISAICKHLSPLNAFEFGTYTGETTWTMARHLPPNSHVYTLDIPKHERPSWFPDYVTGQFFHNTTESSRIIQLLGWSEHFDYSPFVGKMDLVYIDADHSYSGVKFDSERAFELASPNGIIIWDDYRYLPCHVGCKGVSDYLHEISGEIPVYQLSGTRLAVCRNAERSSFRP